VFSVLNVLVLFDEVITIGNVTVLVQGCGTIIRISLISRNLLNPYGYQGCDTNFWFLMEYAGEFPLLIQINNVCMFQENGHDDMNAAESMAEDNLDSHQNLEDLCRSHLVCALQIYAHMLIVVNYIRYLLYLDI
jgi:hypothetical protein